MIIPIYGTAVNSLSAAGIAERVTLRKDIPHEAMTISVFNRAGVKIGYVAEHKGCNQRVFKRMNTDDLRGEVWALFKNQTLIKLDLS